MAQKQIDYDALAKQHGGTVVATPAVDYDAIAREVGGTATAPESPAQPSGGIGGFLSEATAGLNPVKMNEALQAAFWHPIETGKGLLAAQDVPRQEAMSAFEQGDYLTGTRKMIDWLIPVLGPRLDEAADYMQEGQYARGLGAATDVGVAIATPRIVGGVAGALPTRAGVAQALNRGAESRVVRTIAPQVGPQKIRFGTMAAEVAPDIARRTTARTVGGLVDEVGEHAARANQALDAAYAASPATATVATQPVLAGLQREVRQLTVRGVAPANRAARMASLNQAIAEVQALGPRASLRDLRNLRQAWDAGAQDVFTPITADNFRAVREAGHGWADARTVLNEVMVQNRPELAGLNADAALWIRARDVMQAAQEIEQVRPRVGRRILAQGLGAATGATMGGGWGAAFGAVVAPSIEAALASASPTVKLTVARGMAQLADALQAGQPGRVAAAVNLVTAALPGAQRAAVVAQATRLLRDLQPAAGVAEPASSPVAGSR
jgi:hypothetical protein